jgi:hypothetical protein
MWMPAGTMLSPCGRTPWPIREPAPIREWLPIRALLPTAAPRPRYTSSPMTTWSPTMTTVVERAGYDGDSENVRVSSLNRVDGEPATEEDANAVHIVSSYNGHHSTVPVVAGWKELGFTLRYSGYGASAANKGPMTEEQKAERKTLIENNKLMQSATVVRRDFVKALLTKKQPPKGWQHFTVHAITHHPETASGYEGTVAAEMAGAKTGETSDRWTWPREPAAGPRGQVHGTARGVPDRAGLRRV